MANPTAVPTSARHAIDPVDEALVRSTDRVPSTTQKPCCTPVRSATATATASATEPRAALRNHTDRRLACRSSTVASSSSATRRDSGRGGPVSGWPYQLRRTAAIVSGSARRAAISASAAALRAATAMVWAWNACAAAARTAAGSPVSWP